MSMVSYAAGARFLQLLGGVSLSFYDWYCDLPPASPEIWGEQTDVGESADWYKSRFIAVVGSNVLGTRTPDAHFLVEARHRGTKVVVFSPDFSQTAKVADEWIPLHQGQDGAFWMAVGPRALEGAPRRAPGAVLPRLPEALQRRAVPGRARAPGEPRQDGAGPRYRPGKMLRASRLAATRRGRERRVEALRARRGDRRAPDAEGHRRPPLAGEEGGVEPARRGLPDRRAVRAGPDPGRPRDRARAGRAPRLHRGRRRGDRGALGARPAASRPPTARSSSPPPSSCSSPSTASPPPPRRRATTRPATPTTPTRSPPPGRSASPG